MKKKPYLWTERNSWDKPLMDKIMGITGRTEFAPDPEKVERFLNKGVDKSCRCGTIYK